MNDSLLLSTQKDATLKNKYCSEKKGHRWGDWQYLNYCNLKQRFCEDCPKCDSVLIKEPS